MRVEHAGLGLDFTLPPLLQRDVEAFYAALRELAPGWRRWPSAEYAGAFVRAAARLGWLPGIVEADIDAMPPGKVLYLGIAIDAHVGAAIAVPKASVSPSPTTSSGAASAPPN